MTYTHSGRQIVELCKDPVDVDSTDWVYFVYEDWLQTDETIDSHSALITGGTIVTDSTYIGTMTDQNGTEHTNVYGVQFSVTSTSTEVTITHRVTTSTSGSVDLARIDIDHTITIPVEIL